MLNRRSLLAALAASPLAGPALAQGGPIVAPIRLADERVLIDATINGDGPHAFAIDTGAVVSGVEEQIAKRLGLPVLRKVKLLGSEFDLFKVSDLVLGGTVRQTDAALFGLRGNLRGAEGLVAAGMVTTFDSTLDFDAKQWRVYPGGLSERPGYEKLNSWVRIDAGANGSKRIGVEVVLDGTPLKLLVDTGMPRAITLERDVGRKLGYWDDSKPFAPVAGAGISGPYARPSRATRAGLLQVGSRRFERPVVTVRDIDPYKQDYQGVIGLPILETMNLSVDTKGGGALWVQPNSRPVWRERLSRTGLWVDAAPGGAKVSIVGTGSPAAAAGLKVGDRIAGESFPAILKTLAADQAPITLQVQGRGAVTLQPADYL